MFLNRHGTVIMILAPNLLDLILSTEEGMVQELKYLPPLGESDHLCLRFDIKYNQNKHNKLLCEHDIHKTDYEAVRLELSKHNWNEQFNSSFEVDYNYFVNILLRLIEENSPKKLPPKNRKNIFMTKEALRLKKRK